MLVVWLLQHALTVQGDEAMLSFCPQKCKTLSESPPGWLLQSHVNLCVIIWVGRLHFDLNYRRSCTHTGLRFCCHSVSCSRSTPAGCFQIHHLFRCRRSNGEVGRWCTLVPLQDHCKAHPPPSPQSGRCCWPEKRGSALTCSLSQRCWKAPVQEREQERWGKYLEKLSKELRSLGQVAKKMFSLGKD